MNGLGKKGAAKAAQQPMPPDELIRKTELTEGAASPGQEKKEPLVRKTLEIPEGLDDRLNFYCRKMGKKTEASVIREALDKFLPPLPEEMKRV